MTLTAQQATETGVFTNTIQQARVAVDCLRHAEKKYDGEMTQILPYLVHSAVLLFTARDVLAFQSVYSSPVYKKLALSQKLRQLPSLNQLQAVIASYQSKPVWEVLDEADLAVIAGLDAYGDQTLGIVELKAFRDAVIQWGVPVEQVDAAYPFELPVADYPSLLQVLVKAWAVLDPS